MREFGFATFVCIAIVASTSCSDKDNGGGGNTPSTDDVRTMIDRGGEYLLSVQDNDSASPTHGSLMPGHPPLEKDNITGSAADGLLVAWRVTGDQKYLDGAKAAGEFIAQRHDHFSTGDARLLARLSRITGDTHFSDAANTYFFDALQAGTYGPNLLDWPRYLQQVTARRAGQGANLVAWELGAIVQAANLLDRPERHEYLASLEQALDELHASDFQPDGVYWDAHALTHGVQVIMEMGDPDHYVCQGTNDPMLSGLNASQLATLVQDRLVNSGPAKGALPYMLIPSDARDDVQATAYGLTLLSRSHADSNVLKQMVSYLGSMQESSGAFGSGLGYDSSHQGAVAPEVVAETLAGMLMATPDAVFGGSESCHQAAAFEVSTPCS